MANLSPLPLMDVLKSQHNITEIEKKLHSQNFHNLLTKYLLLFALHTILARETEVPRRISGGRREGLRTPPRLAYVSRPHTQLHIATPR